MRRFLIVPIAALVLAVGVPAPAKAQVIVGYPSYYSPYYTSRPIGEGGLVELGLNVALNYLAGSGYSTYAGGYYPSYYSPGFYSSYYPSYYSYPLYTGGWGWSGYSYPGSYYRGWGGPVYSNRGYYRSGGRGGWGGWRGGGRGPGRR